MEKNLEPIHWNLKQYKRLTKKQISFAIAFWEVWGKYTNHCRLSSDERRMFNTSYTALKKLEKENGNVEYKDLIWKEEGFLFEKDDFFPEEENDIIFFQGEKLEEAIKGCFRKGEAWFNKYTLERSFTNEDEALEDALDCCEEDNEIKLLAKRDEKLREL